MSKRLSGTLWRCRRCQEILAVITSDGRVWVAAEVAEWYRESLTYRRVPCPQCRRMNMQRLADGAISARLSSGGGRGRG